MSKAMRVIYRGEILAGFDKEQVKRTAAISLKASATQIETLFSGRGVILKKNLAADTGERYLSVLARIGMKATLEAMPETDAGAAQASPPPLPQASPSAAEPRDAERETERMAMGTQGILASFSLSSLDPLRAEADEASAHPAPPPMPEWMLPRPPLTNKPQEAAASSPARPRTATRVGPSSANSFNAAPPTIVAPSQKVRAKIRCPACGFQQPRRMICERCGHDMTRPAPRLRSKAQGGTEAYSPSTSPETVFAPPRRRKNRRAAEAPATEFSPLPGSLPFEPRRKGNTDWQLAAAVAAGLAVAVLLIYLAPSA